MRRENLGSYRVSSKGLRAFRATTSFLYSHDIFTLHFLSGCSEWIEAENENLPIKFQLKTPFRL